LIKQITLTQSKKKLMIWITRLIEHQT